MKLFDLHNDFLTVGLKEIPKEYGKDVEVVGALFKGDRSFSEILSLAEKYPIVAFEDAGYDDFSVEKIEKFRPVYVGLTWNVENRYGYGCNYPYGLKSDGFGLIKDLNAANIAVDTAHLSKGGFIDVIENADSVINSHTCFCGAYSHKRNIEDWQIKLISEKGGIVGMTLCGYFTTSGKTCKIEDIICQIDYFSQKFGVENLAVGTDFYGTDFLPCENGDYSFFDTLKANLMIKGYKEEDVEKIFYGNINKFLERKKWKCRKRLTTIP